MSLLESLVWMPVNKSPGLIVSNAEYGVIVEIIFSA